MENFLKCIAELLYTRSGNSLREHCLVFPGRRSGLFFLKHLAAGLEKPLWTPAVMTINELFRSLSKLKQAENEILLFELYKVYRSLSKSGETFDDFYFWGDMLLNDIDDTDKYLADASKLFRNVTDLKKIDQQFGGLTVEQVEIIQRFWVNFNPGLSTGTKEKFISVWSILEPLYNEFRKVLASKNLAYEGMIFRDVAEDPDRLDSTLLNWNTYHFIGFNALNECEKKLMLKLKESGRARFYWDYDSSYLSEGGINSAGYFLRTNLKVFGNDMPKSWSNDTFISAPAGNIRRRIIETSSDIAQVKLIPGLIGEIPGLTPDNAHDTAVVLADENLLVPVLTSLPENIQDINITMGYPLKQTSAYSLVKQLIELQRNIKDTPAGPCFNHEDVHRLLKNELVSGLMSEEDLSIPSEIVRKNLMLVPAGMFSGSAGLSGIFVKAGTAEKIPAYIKKILTSVVSGDKEVTDSGVTDQSLRNEYIYRIILAINRLEAVTQTPEVPVTADTWTRLLDRILRAQSVPFSGEPLSGIQIMGILETRALDFKNLIMLSVNEGIMPAVTTSSSFIPFSLRQAFGLPSLNHQESIYAYHFYRLLHRAENVIFIYNSNPEGSGSGEMSRFLQQMKFDPLMKPAIQNMSYGIRNPVTIGNTVARTGDHTRALLERFPQVNSTRPLSPSAINVWLHCRMKFYYQYINGLSEPKKVINEIDPAVLGSMVHNAIKRLYESFVGKTVDPATIRSFTGNREGLSELIRSTVSEVLKRESESFAAINEMIVREVLMTYLLRILEIDLISAPFRIISIERPHSFSIKSGRGGETYQLRAGGNIDRVDQVNGTTRIVDYKTGKTSDSVENLADLFVDDREKDPDPWLQTLIYCEAYLSEYPGARVRPSVYKLKKVPGDSPDDKLIVGNSVIEDYVTVRQEFLLNLTQLVNTIFNSEEPFVMTREKTRKCPWCPFRVLCGR